MENYLQISKTTNTFCAEKDRNGHTENEEDEITESFSEDISEQNIQKNETMGDVNFKTRNGRMIKKNNKITWLHRRFKPTG